MPRSMCSLMPLRAQVSRKDVDARFDILQSELQCSQQHILNSQAQSTHVSRVTEVLLPKLVLLDLQPALQNFFGLWSTNGDVNYAIHQRPAAFKSSGAKGSPAILV